VRGSSGYGQEYLDLDNYKNRLHSVQDLKAGADWLIAEGYSAPGLLAVKGGSYGGYMTLAAITEYPTLFNAAIDDVGIANFVTFLENTADYRRYLREAEYGPLSDPEFLTSISPIHKAGDIETPLLVVHGRNDPRVPVGEAEQIAAAIEAKGGTVELLIFEDEGHGVSKRANILILYRRMVEFLSEHLTGPETP
jgi:dipeptidyl aminopeptidase/acylaminoacyl peptidase